jgi:hypothetical protein
LGKAEEALGFNEPTVKRTSKCPKPIRLAVSFFWEKIAINQGYLIEREDPPCTEVSPRTGANTLQMRDMPLYRHE